jgi:inhibitor of KinA sporulation pathway (predicted exonuclease)
MYYLCILDFEATCSDTNEFPSVLLKVDGNKVDYVSEIQQFIKPITHPKLTKFCTQLTGITQDKVDNGITFKKAYETHYKWINDNVGKNEVYIVTCGDWDLKTILPR